MLALPYFIEGLLEAVAGCVDISLETNHRGK